MDLQESDLFMEALGTSKSSSSSSRKHKPLKLAAASALIKKPTPIPVPTSATTALTESAQNLSPVEKSPAAIAASQTLNILNTNRVKYLIKKQKSDLLNLLLVQSILQPDNLKFTILINNLNKYKLKTTDCIFKKKILLHHITEKQTIFIYIHY